MSPNRRAVIATAPALLLALTACSTGSTEGSDTKASGGAGEAEPGAFPVTVEHAHGKTKITEAPKRVATVGWSDQDVVAALGVVPVGATKITWGGNKRGSTPWFDKAVAKIDPDAEITRYDDADGIPVAEIAKLSPDLVLGVNSGMTKEEYDKLTKIAPTVAYPDLAWATPWEDSITIIGKALGKPDEAKDLLEKTNDVIDEGIAEYPEIKGKTVAWASIVPTDLSKIDIYTTNDLRPQLLRRFGMKDGPLVAKHSEGEKFFFSISAEKARDIKADVLIFYADGQEQIEKITKDPLLGEIPAIKKGHYVASADRQVSTTLSSPSPLSMEVAVTKFVPEIAKAVKGKSDG
ncbi:iron-siderophore ABC transporter substrate-binding protein [Janibacter corallicola]|uniref:iron-siderophore ABC transporter substrate-binding protein n=1 Tax=Janibacter corallicola TaxID=415212 RepID=UPI00082E0866|nr:iron-siderophore ABC transporter substrate-binding protein [Janibacter corallicola]